MVHRREETTKRRDNELYESDAALQTCTEQTTFAANNY